MKKILTLAVCLLSLNSWAFQKTIVPVTNVFVPSGFDSNDNSELYLTGYLPNLCHQGPSYKTKIENGVIYINVMANTVTSADFCPEVIVPFSTVISLGQLKANSYSIVVNGNSRFRLDSSIQVSKPQSQRIDEYLYAAVKDIKITNDTIYLKGVNPSDCFSLREIQVVHNGRDTYAILPKLSMKSRKCSQVATPFLYKKKFEHSLGTEKALFHVRVMDGRSINKVVDFTEL